MQEGEWEMLSSPSAEEAYSTIKRINVINDKNRVKNAEHISVESQTVGEHNVITLLGKEKEGVSEDVECREKFKKRVKGESSDSD